MKEVVTIKVPKDARTFYYEAGDLELNKGDWCLIKTERGVDLARVVEEKRIINDYEAKEPIPKIVRKATDRDFQMARTNEAKEREAYQVCLKKIKELELSMKLASTHYSLDGNKITFYFTADGRIDFRELVKELAYIFKARIELFQIGVRDEAKMLGEMSWCGQHLCCARFLNDFEPVSIKMAKEQGLILTPSKISGVCGRLMCCLSYEYETYRCLRANSPKEGRRVKTKEGEGKIIKTNVIKKTVLVEIKDEDTKKMIEIPFEEILEN